MSLKILVSMIGLLASIISIYAFFSGNQDIYEVINQKNKKPLYVKVQNNLDSLKDGLYIEYAYVRNVPVVVAPIADLICALLGGNTDDYYIMSHNSMKLLLRTKYDVNVEIRFSPNNRRFIMYTSNVIHIANLDGTNHVVYDINNGGVSNVVFITNTYLKLNLFPSFDGSSFRDEYPLTFGQFKINSSGLYEIQLDEQNLLSKINKIE